MCNSSTTPYKLFWICFTKCLLWVAYYQNRNTIIIIETYDYTLKYTPLMRIKTKICVSRWKKYTINNSMKACILSVHLCCLSFVSEFPDYQFLTSDSETAWDVNTRLSLQQEWECRCFDSKSPFSSMKRHHVFTFWRDHCMKHNYESKTESTQSHWLWVWDERVRNSVSYLYA